MRNFPKEMLKYSLKGGNEYMRNFVEIEDHLIDWYTKSQKLKSELYVSSQTEAKDSLFLASIFSDITSTYLLNRTKGNTKLHYLDEQHPKFQKRISIPENLGVNISGQTHSVMPAYIF